MEPTAVRAKYRVKNSEATDPRPPRPKRSCTYRGTSRPRGPRTTRFTTRTLSTFRTTGTSGAGFTLGRDRKDEMKKRGDTDL